jgi:hypothetical protein
MIKNKNKTERNEKLKKEVDWLLISNNLPGYLVV